MKLFDVGDRHFCSGAYHETLWANR